MQHDSNVQTAEAEIPLYLQCPPRTFNVKYDQFSDVCELEFTLVIKCTDEMLHEQNQFWSQHKDRLKENDGDIVKVLLKMIAVDVFNACFQGKDNVGIAPFKWGINTIFQEEGWSSDCFEITKLYFHNYVSGNDFEFKPVQIEGVTS